MAFTQFIKQIKVDLQKYSLIVNSVWFTKTEDLFGSRTIAPEENCLPPTLIPNPNL